MWISWAAVERVATKGPDSQSRPSVAVTGMITEAESLEAGVKARRSVTQGADPGDCGRRVSLGWLGSLGSWRDAPGHVVAGEPHRDR
jgi:hypothetical protein